VNGEDEDEDEDESPFAHILAPRKYKKHIHSFNLKVNLLETVFKPDG